MECLAIKNTQAPAQGPPLPPEGLPHGWTMEQWIWYGEDYLKIARCCNNNWRRLWGSNP